MKYPIDWARVAVYAVILGLSALFWLGAWRVGKWIVGPS